MFTLHKNTERRSAAKKQKEALFYDSGERRRMWMLVGTLVLVILVLVAGYVPLFGVLTKLYDDKSTIKVFAVERHDNGPATVIGEVDPLHGDSTLKILQQNATEDIELTMTVSTYDQLKRNKAKMLNRTADAMGAHDFVEAHFDRSFDTYKQSRVEPTYIDCQPEGQWKGADDKTVIRVPVRFDCFYYLGAVDTPTTDATSGAASHPPRYESHVELVQARGTDDPQVIYDNPDEIYATTMDAKALP